jgi:hypothetical protein
MSAESSDFEYLDKIARGTVPFNFREASEPLARIAYAIPGERISIETFEAALHLRTLLNQLNNLTGEVVLQIESAESSTRVISIVMESLAHCGSPLHRGTIIAGARHRLGALGRPITW